MAGNTKRLVGMRALAVAGIALLVSGCASTTYDVSVFHDLSPTAPLKYAVVPLADQEGSLEHKSYRELVKAELNKRGYIETSAVEADVNVFLFYGIDAEREVLSSYPIFGQTGTTYTYIPGPLTTSRGLPTYNPGTTISSPTYGVVGTATSSSTVFGSYLLLDIVDRAESLKEGKVKKRYEAKVIGIGSSRQLCVVVPAMIDALFQDFPGTSGSTRSVDMPTQ